MSTVWIEFYEDDRLTTNYGQPMYGRLLSSVEDTTPTTTVEHVSVPGNAQYASVSSDVDLFVEIGSGNQDCTSTRRARVVSNMPKDFSVRGTDTLSYRSIT